MHNQSLYLALSYNPQNLKSKGFFPENLRGEKRKFLTRPYLEVTDSRQRSPVNHPRAYTFLMTGNTTNPTTNGDPTSARICGPLRPSWLQSTALRYYRPKLGTAAFSRISGPATTHVG